MSSDKTTQSVDIELKKLENRIDELISVCDKLGDENKELRDMQKDLHTDRNELMRKNELVKGRVEAMIARLRSMEKHP